MLPSQAYRQPDPGAVLTALHEITAQHGYLPAGALYAPTLVGSNMPATGSRTVQPRPRTSCWLVTPSVWVRCGSASTRATSG